MVNENKQAIRKEVILSNNVAIRDDKKKEITYKELYYESEQIADLIEERSLVFVLCDHHIETLAFIYEVILQNRVPLLLSGDISQEFLERYIGLFRPSYIYCSSLHKIKEGYDCLLEMKAHVLLSTKEEKIELHSDLALLLCTSGTTGSPKLVKLSYENLYNSFKYVGSYFDISQEQVGISASPINFIFGIGVCFLHWHCGATILTTEYPIFSLEFNQFFTSERVNNFAAVPFIYQTLNRIGFWNNEKLGNLHWAMTGGAQMSETEIKNMISILGDKFWMVYGQTECVGTVLGINYKKEESKISSIGRPLEHIDISLDNKTDELVIHTKAVCMGYATCAEELKLGDVNHGIWHTGDVAYIDEDGYFYLKGRIARFIKILGNRISLDEIERYLKEKYNEIEFACIGVDDKIEIYHSGDIKRNKEITILLSEIFKIPEKFVSCYIISEIPRTESGKIQYVKLKEYSNGAKDS